MLAVVAMAVVLYESLLLLLLSVVEKRGLVLLDPPRYGNAFAEITCVTGVLAVFAQTYEVSAALNSPAFVVYALIICREPGSCLPRPRLEPVPSQL